MMLSRKYKETISVYMNPEKLTDMRKHFKIALILVAMCIAIRFMHAMVDRFFSQSQNSERSEKRKVNTLKGIVKAC